MSLTKRPVAEFIGTFWLVFGGCGSAVLAAKFPDVGIGLLGVALAFGLTLLTMAYAFGHVSGCHINPAVSIGLFTAGRFPASELAAYIVAQVLGGIAGAGMLYLIASGNPAFNLASGFAENGYRIHSPGGYSMTAGFIMEVLLTFFFLLIILGSTDKRAPQGFAPLALGFGLIDSPHWDSSNKHVRDSRTQYGARSHRPGLGAGAIVDVLDCTDPRRRPGWVGLRNLCSGIADVPRDKTRRLIFANGT